MKVILTTEQFSKFSNLVKEADEIDLNKPVDLSKVSSNKDLKTAITTIGLQHSKESKTRGISSEIRKILSDIEKLEDKEIFEKYFIKISELISTYKKESYSLKKLAEIVKEISEKDINIAKKQIEDITSIFEDPKFSESYKKKLIKIITTPGEVDLDKFYNETKKLYQEYEDSFAEGPLSPFTVFRTSPRLNLLMSKNYSYNNVLFSAEEFNLRQTDVSKVLYLIDKLREIKVYGSINDAISFIVSSLPFKITFDYSDKNVKADLKLKESLRYEDKLIKKTTIIGLKDDLIEVKLKNYDKPDYLSEFFKIDSSNETDTLLVNRISKIPKVINPRETFKVFMMSFVDNLVKTINDGEGEKIINHITKNLAAMIFNNHILVPKENIAFYWNNVGYGKKNRLSIWYKVTENPTLYKISKTEEGYTRFIQKV